MLARLGSLARIGARIGAEVGTTRSASSNTSPASPLRRRLLWSLGIGSAASLLVVQPSREDLMVAYLTPVRLARDVACAASIVADYYTSLRPDLQGEAREAALRGCHQRGAQRLLQLCFANGGIYTKLGQHVGQLDHLLPEEYVSTMREHLLDRCPVSPPEEVRRIFLQDLGAPPEALFASFSERPIASASLAQVHEAVDHSGRRLAVKVQHAGLRESCAADVATVAALVATVRWIFPSFDYGWLVDEIRENLPRELNFLHEAANAERCRANLEASARGGAKWARQVHVPSIEYRTTTTRILTMEFIDGAGVTDRAALSRLGVSPRQVSLLVAEAFNDMIFRTGYVHCDPHAANMLVRRAPNGAAQLVLLDHGLYKEITDSFRLEYAGLWRSLIFADADGIRRHSAAMNAGDAYDVFACILTQRPWEQIVDTRSDTSRLAIERSPETRAAAAEFMAQYGREINDLLARMPRPLLLLLKTNDCLRSVDHALGNPVNTFAITARECGAALRREQLRHHPGPLVEARMMALSLLMWYGRMQAVLGWNRGADASGETTAGVGSSTAPHTAEVAAA
ncbi:hypothetical protein HYH03_002701 [Edaphochlamys debaryana]|uniref:ABC1 atypical kinase-like domain-containing protein n=1 Tax=Edaphochlamys debaryana TaxID=47281 RepID=A0A835YD80_9CHLO|nr:hypothetical protein HYH03_002701 [Edaphochlamys debaryana]|eukprot:KAG2499118.1 hypothetical protein HYH03_002701 [Edaphochlamys debaryana]